MAKRGGRSIRERIPTEWTAYTAQVIEDNIEDLYRFAAQTLPANRGGIGFDEFTIGDLLYADTDESLALLAVGASGTALLGGTIPNWGKVDLTTTVTDVLPPANGGTGLSSYTVGDLLYADGTASLAKLAAVVTGNALISGGAGAAPSWGKIGLTTHVSGTLPIANGGTNITTYTTGDILYASATNTLAKLPLAGFNGQILQRVSGQVSWSPLIYPVATALGTLMVGGSTSVWSTLAHPSAAGRLLVSASSGVNVAWTSAAFPTTATTGQILYASASNVWSALGIGSTGQVLTVSGAGIPAWAAASGGVSGPGSSTDNAVARWNGTGGNTLQDSGMTVADGTNASVTGTQFQIIRDGGAMSLLVDGHNASGEGGVWNTRATRGTLAAPTVVASGDRIGRFFAQGWSGAAGAYVISSLIQQAIDGTPDSGGDTTDMPGRVEIYTTADGSNVPTEAFRVNHQQNVFIHATPVYPSAGSKGLIFGEGTALSGMGTNTAGLYADDVAGTVEMFAIDEAGNNPQLTPHNFELFDPPTLDAAHPVTEYPWSYSARNAYLGIEIGVDMARLVVAVEKLTGEKLAHVRPIPKRSWTDDQQRNVAFAQEQMRVWLEGQASGRQDEPIPPTPVVREMPTWMQSRLAPADRSRMTADLQNLRGQVESWRRELPTQLERALARLQGGH
jgi:hypothetical protein